MMATLQARLLSHWLSLDDAQRLRQHALMLCVALYLVHVVLLSSWYIEDAAISFAYARNAAAGEGFVSWAGGERVEGFSDPTWALLLAAFSWLHVTPWVAAKLLGASFGAVTLLLAERWARRVSGPGLLSLAVPLLLALSPQFVVWSASGLENGLFNLLLTLGAVLLLDEMDGARRWPWSGLALSLLAITRPEAPLYAASAGLLGLFWLVRRQGQRAALRWGLRWGLLFAGPFGAWHAWELWYFAWPFPNTYYAKLGETRFQPFRWGKAGWNYLRGYALWSAQGLMLPAYILGQSGLRGRRAALAVALIVVTALLCAPGLGWPFALLEALGTPLDFKEPELLVQVRVLWLAGLLSLLPWLGLGRSNEAPRVLAWSWASVTLFFALYAGGDWMDGWRWMSLATVPMAVLLVDVAAQVSAELHAGLRPRYARWGALVLLAPTAIASVVGSGIFISSVETSPFTVNRRVQYLHAVMLRLHIEHASLMEVDFGAPMWWWGDELIDLAGLADLPLGHHNWERPFIREYIYDERRPTFAHMHGYWMRKGRMRVHPGWRDYLELPGVPVSPWRLHVGNHLRKSTFIDRQWRGPANREVQFGKRAVLAGWDLPVPIAVAGDGIYLEVGYKRSADRGDFRLLAVLSGQGRQVVHELPPAYDWLPPKRWKADQVVHGRHTLSLPSDLPTGRYDLALVVLDEQGVVAPVRLPSGALGDDPVYARGEVRWPAVVEISDRDTVLRRGRELLDQASSRAAAGRCAQAEASRTLAREHLPKTDWTHAADPELKGAIARCWAAKALSLGRVRAIRRARRWDHRDPEVVSAGRELADRWQAEGDAAQAAGRSEQAYDKWSAALSADPSRAWLRRRAEALRDQRLGISATGPPTPEEK